MSLVTISKDPPLFNPKFQLDRVPTPYIDSEKTPTSKENDSFQVFVRARPLNSKELVSANSKKKLSIMKKQENMVNYLNLLI